MSVSLKKRRGAIHVKAGRLVRVAMDHPVPTKGREAHVGAPVEDFFKGAQGPATFVKNPVARQGDLAIELLGAKSGKLVGRSYLTGEAINIVYYSGETLDPAMFASARVERLPISKDFISDVEAFAAARFGGTADVYVFFAKCRNKPHVDSITHAVNFLWNAEPDNENIATALQGTPVYLPTLIAFEAHRHKEDIAGKRHLVGLLRWKKRAAVLHFQPPHHADDRLCATPFQAQLLLQVAERG